MKVLSRILPILSLGIVCLPLQAEVVSIKKSDLGVAVEIDGKLFTEYRVKDVPRPFLFPIIGASGENIVRSYPMVEGVEGEAQDHIHHKGLWFAHGAVNGEDFWSELKDFGKQVATSVESSSEGNTGVIKSSTDWVSANGQRQLVDERVITITALPDGEKLIDFDITLKAVDKEVLLGDTKEGTMAIRVNQPLSFKAPKGQVATGKAFNSNNETQADIWGKKADWVSYYGPDSKGGTVAVSILSHPSNFRSPTTWHARDYGLFAVNPFGIHDFEGLKKGDQDGKGDLLLKKGESVQMRYRFYFSKGEPNKGLLDKQFSRYKEEVK